MLHERGGNDLEAIWRGGWVGTGALSIYSVSILVEAIPSQFCSPLYTSSSFLFCLVHFHSDTRSDVKLERHLSPRVSSFELLDLSRHETLSLIFNTLLFNLEGLHVSGAEP